MVTTKTIWIGLVLSAVSGYVIRTAKAEKPAQNILGTVTFDDLDDDLMRSDGGGTYPEKPPGGSSWLYLKFGAGWLTFDPGFKRAVFLDLEAACVSGDCERPFDEGLADIYLRIQGVGQSIASMQPGTELPAVGVLEVWVGKFLRWEFRFTTEFPEAPVMTVTAGEDTNGDGVPNSWYIRNPIDSRTPAWKVDGAEGIREPVGVFTLPFGFVFQAD